MTKSRSNATAPAAKGELVIGTGTDASGILSVGANDTVLTADSSTSTGLKWAAAASGGMTLLSTTTLSSTTTTISSINQGYKHLFAIYRAVHSSGGSFAIRTNGITTANYYYNPTQIGNGLAFGSFWNNGSAEFGFPQNIPSDTNNTGYLWIYDYSHTAVTFKFTESKIYSDGGDDILGIQGVNRGTGTSGINSITFFSPSANTISGTVLLYGVS